LRPAKKRVRRTRSRQRVPPQTPDEKERIYKRIQENLDRVVNIALGSSNLQEQIAVAVKEALGKRMQLGERSLEVLEEMQRIILDSRTPTQKESLNESSITREYIR
jgi:hypothetical protein